MDKPAELSGKNLIFHVKSPIFTSKMRRLYKNKLKFRGGNFCIDYDLIGNYVHHIIVRCQSSTGQRCSEIWSTHGRSWKTFQKFCSQCPTIRKVKSPKKSTQNYYTYATIFFSKQIEINFGNEKKKTPVHEFVNEQAFKPNYEFSQPKKSSTPPPKYVSFHQKVMIYES